jgi:hypothetical protein
LETTKSWGGELWNFGVQLRVFQINHFPSTCLSRKFVLTNLALNRKSPRKRSRESLPEIDQPKEFSKPVSIEKYETLMLDRHNFTDIVLRKT